MDVLFLNIHLLHYTLLLYITTYYECGVGITKRGSCEPLSYYHMSLALLYQFTSSIIPLVVADDIQLTIDKYLLCFFAIDSCIGNVCRRVRI